MLIFFFIFKDHLLSILQLSTSAISTSCCTFQSILRQVHKLLPHELLYDSLHLHRTNFSKLSGAASKSVITGVCTVPLSFQPQCLWSCSSFLCFLQRITLQVNPQAMKMRCSLCRWELLRIE